MENIESRESIPVLKPGVDIALPGKEQPELDAAAKKLYEDTLPKTVQIVNDGGKMVGSGFFMDRNGSIGSAAHVLLGAREHFAITSDGTRYKVQIEKMDDINDSVILKPLGFKPGSRPHAELAGSTQLRAGDPIFAMGHPGGLRPAYISPGKFEKALTQEGLIRELDPNADADLKNGLENFVTNAEKADVKAALDRALFSAEIHIRPGDSGGPVFNSKGEVLGMNDMISSFKRGFFVPSEKLQALYESQDSKFEFSYQRLAAPWAQEYKNTWQEKPLIALSETAAAGTAGFFASRLMKTFPKSIGGSALLAEGLLLSNDASKLLESTDTLDKVKYGLASTADLGALASGITFLGSKYKTGGMIGLALSLGGRLACEFIPTHLVLKDINRKNDSLRPPLDPAIQKTLGF